MATLLDGDLKEAAQRSQTMHTIRNFSAAMLIPIIAYTIKNHIQKGTQSIYAENITDKMIYLKKLQDVAIDADHQIFLLMIIFNMVMFVSSIIQMILGKGRRITQVIHCNVPSSIYKDLVLFFRIFSSYFRDNTIHTHI